MIKVLGVDEARRGPVIGPLIISGVIIEEKDEIKLKKLGVKDSKLLTPKKREELYPKILEIVKRYKIVEVSPSEIDAALESQELNLNWLEAHKTAQIINELKPDKAFIDCPSPNKKRFDTPLGPGYMSNIITQKFLKENWEKHPEIFRKSWISWKNHKNHKEQKGLGEF